MSIQLIIIEYLISFLKYLLCNLENKRDDLKGIDYKCTFTGCTTRKLHSLCLQHEQERIDDCFNYHCTSIWNSFKHLNFDSVNLNIFQEVYDKCILQEISLRKLYIKKYNISKDNEHAFFESKLEDILYSKSCTKCNLRVNVYNSNYGDLRNHIFNVNKSCCEDICELCKDRVFDICNTCKGIVPIDQQSRIKRVKKYKQLLNEQHLNSILEEQKEKLAEEIKSLEIEVEYCLEYIDSNKSIEANQRYTEISDKYYNSNLLLEDSEEYIQSLIDFLKVFNKVDITSFSNSDLWTI